MIGNRIGSNLTLGTGKKAPTRAQCALTGSQRPLTAMQCNLAGGLTGGAQGIWGAVGEAFVAPAFPDPRDSDADGEPDAEDPDDDNDGLDDDIDDDDDGDGTPDELDKDHPACPLNPNFGK